MRKVTQNFNRYYLRNG